MPLLPLTLRELHRWQIKAEESEWNDKIQKCPRKKMLTCEKNGCVTASSLTNRSKSCCKGWIQIRSSANSATYMKSSHISKTKNTTLVIRTLLLQFRVHKHIQMFIKLRLESELGWRTFLWEGLSKAIWNHYRRIRKRIWWSWGHKLTILFLML